MSQKKYANYSRGFTLIELLVVISIILIASSIIFIGGNSGDGAKLSSSQRIISGIAQGARGQAILKNARTRLIIYANDTAATQDPEKYLRFFGIIYEEAPDSNKWIAATQGTYLPEGIYFDADTSTENGSTWVIENKKKFKYPLISAEAEGSGDDYYYYEFNSNGTMATGFQNAWLVVRANTLKPNSSGVLEIDFKNIEDSKKYLAAALIFRRVGTTTPVSNPDDIIK